MAVSDKSVLLQRNVRSGFFCVLVGEIALLEGLTVVYKSNIDLFFYVIGSSHENEVSDFRDIFVFFPSVFFILIIIFMAAVPERLRQRQRKKVFCSSENDLLCNSLVRPLP